MDAAGRGLALTATATRLLATTTYSPGWHPKAVMVRGRLDVDCAEQPVEGPVGTAPVALDTAARVTKVRSRLVGSDTLSSEGKVMATAVLGRRALPDSVQSVPKGAEKGKGRGRGQRNEYEQTNAYVRSWLGRGKAPGMMANVPKKVQGAGPTPLPHTRHVPS